MKSSNCLKCNKKINSGHAKYGLHAHCFANWFEVDAQDEFNNIARKDSNSPADPGLQTSERWNSSFFHGKFLKYAADLGGNSYIIKLQDNLASELPFVEYLSNQIADSIGIKHAPFFCIIFYEKPAFVTLNLVGKHSEIKSLAHIYHYVPTPSQYNCESLIKIIHHETQNLNEVENFIEICLFDSLIGNHDRHGRNLALMIDSVGKILCPAYDNPSALGLEQGEILKANFSPRGKIATTENIEPTMKDYIFEFSRLGHQQSVSAFYKKIDMKIINQLISKSFCSDLMKNAVLKLVLSRYQEMSDALQN